jgi:hypothetical protein
MNLTDTQQDIVVAAWAANRFHNGGGIVIEDWAIPDAHQLSERGWLRHDFTSDGDLMWRWTERAEAALDVSGLLRSADARQN